MPIYHHNSLSRVEIQLIGRPEYCTDVRAAMSGIADPETGVQISVRAPISRIIDSAHCTRGDNLEGRMCRQ